MEHRGSVDQYHIKRQRRKTLALHVLDDGRIEVRAPKWVAKREIVEFVEARADWVLEQRQQVLKKQALKPQFADGEYHYYLGERFPLHVRSAAKASIKLVDGVFSLAVRDPGSAEQIASTLERWYKRQAPSVFEERLFACYEQFPGWFQDKYPMPSLTVRKMKRRWGSCSSRHEVTLNLYLLPMPIACIDYVIVHELCHMEAFHHGKTFYRLLERVMPDWAQREAMIEALA